MSKHLKSLRLARIEENVVRVALAAAALLSIAIAFGIVIVLLREGSGFWAEVSWKDFFVGTTWAPLFEPRQFGILPLVAGTLQITVGSALVAVPAGLGVAFYLNEYAPAMARSVIKPVLEILAGVPTVVYGYFALDSVTPALRTLIPSIESFNGLSAAIVVGLMTLPLVASLADDAIRAVPRSLKEAGYALGATKAEVAMRVTLPAAMSGVIAAFVLAVSRAFGETMAVTLAAGATPKLTADPLVSIQTMTAYIVQVSTGDVPHGSIEYRSIFAVGAVLFGVTLVFNLLAFALVKRFRSVAE